MSAVKQKRPPTSIRRPEDVWISKPELIRRFIERRSDYDQLCAECAYILKKRLQEAGIEVSAVTCRAKTLNSFLEKLGRKTYKDPFADITDLAGTRVVFLYTSDAEAIEKIVRAEFDVLEKVDKLNDKEVDQFGYLATHFIVRLGKGSSGARYDDLKEFVCEVQVRTVLQDAWAIVQHHLVYKRESAVPSRLQRKLNSLAGLFETADDQFEQIRKERQEYVAEVRSSIRKPIAFLQNELNADTLREYLAWKFPDQPAERFSGQLNLILEDIDKAKYTALADLDKAVDATSKTRDRVRVVEGATSAAEDGRVPGMVELAWAIGLTDADFRNNPHMPVEWKHAIDSEVAPK